MPGDPPDDETFTAFDEYDVLTYWTAVHGDVVFIVGDDDIEVRQKRMRLQTQ